MKKILNICLMIVSVIALVGCSNDDAPSDQLMIVKADLAIKAAGGNGSVQYTSAVGEVSATSSADWCKVIDITNNQVNISVDVNTGYEGRTAQLVLTNGINTQQLTVIQEGAVWTYDKNDNEFRVGNALGEIPITMSSSLPIEVDIPDVASKWISFKLTDTGLKLIVEKNETDEVRSAEVKVITGVRETKYVVYQYNPENLLGEWTGVAKVFGSQFGLDAVIPLETNTKIVSNAGKYQFQFPMIDLLNTTLLLTATYRNGMFIITTPQTQNYTLRPQGATWYGSIITMDDKGLYLKGEVAIGPFLVDGKIVMGYMTNAYMSLALFTSKTPSASTYTQASIDFTAILMQKK